MNTALALASTPPDTATAPSEPPQTCDGCGVGIAPGVNFCPVCGIAKKGDALPDPLVGCIVADRYKIIQLVGRGGMGLVYRCEHTHMGKAMAMKLLHGEIAHDRDAQQRFRQEARAASRLSHPNTVGVFDYGTSDGLAYLVMEYVNGKDLGKVLRSAEYLPTSRIASIAIQACYSLAEAHDKGIIHRDLKPENLLVSEGRDGQELIKLLDFGLARLREGEERNEVTHTRGMVGTPYYMAPETIRGQGIDHRVDIYALGAVIYRMATGVPPFVGTSPVAVLTKHLTDEVVPPSKRRPDLHIDPAIDEIVERCMRKDPAERYRRVEEVCEALASYVERRGTENPSEMTIRVSRSEDETSAGKGHQLAVATRNDIEQFERKLRHGRLAAWSAFGLTIALAVGGTGIYRREQQLAAQRPKEVEVEPNDSPDTGTLISEQMIVRGRIGQRINRIQGDVDIYRLSPVPPGEWRLRVELDPQPNIDAVVELVRDGQPTAIAVADDAPEGAREAIAGFRIAGGRRQYYISVHERVRLNVFPRENVSDDYNLRYTLTPIAGNEEIEPNGREEIAGTITTNCTREGYVESRDDLDYWCFETQDRPVRLTLTAPEHLDLELGIHPRDGATEWLIDNAGNGRTETTVLNPTQGRPPCIVVRGSELRPVTQGDADHRYTLRVEGL